MTAVGTNFFDNVQLFVASRACERHFADSYTIFCTLPRGQGRDQSVSASQVRAAALAA